MMTVYKSPARLLLALLVLTGCSKVSTEVQDSQMRFGSVRLFHTAEQARGVVFLFSDLSGWNDAMTASATVLAKAGAIVIGVDLPSYEAKLRASDDGCHYLISEVEDYSKKIQRQFNFPVYLTPILAGRGEGGTLAYVALAQSPFVTVAAAIAVDPVTVLHTKVPLCPGAVGTAIVGGGFSYTPKADLPGQWKYDYTVNTATIPWALPDGAENIPAWREWLHEDRLKIMIQPLLSSTNGSSAGLDDLPLTAIPAGQTGDTLAIVLSGDGGWRDLDKTIGERLATRNIAVVGWDTLRYFWDARTPQQVADDLTRVIKAYGALWNRQRILLVGYSFGADVLPTAYNLLAQDIRDRIGLISLLGMSDTADFQFHVEGWLGVESGTASPTAPEVAKIDKNLLQCLYGDDDAEQFCTNAVFNGAHVVKLSGGHHFDGNYEVLADEILKQWNQQGITHHEP